MAGMGWKALGAAVVRRRVELGYDTRKAFVAATGLGERNVSDVENHRRDSYDAGYLARLEKSLEWPAGTVAALVDGEFQPSMTTNPRTGALIHPDGWTVPPEVADLLFLLGPESPVSQWDRDHIRQALGHLVQVWMAHGLMGGTPDFTAEGEVPAPADVPELERVETRHGMWGRPGPRG